MLRTNTNFLSYIEKIYKEQTIGDIILKEYPKGGFLFRQDDPSFQVAVVESGFVKCFYNEENGKDFILEFLGSGEILGEIEALKSIKCLCNVVAVSDVRIYSFSVSYFETLLENNAWFRRVLLDELAERIIHTSSRAAFQQSYSARYALSRLLYMQQKQDIRLSKPDMASYLGVDIRSLNRMLKETDR